MLFIILISKLFTDSGKIKTKTPARFSDDYPDDGPIEEEGDYSTLASMNLNYKSFTSYRHLLIKLQLLTGSNVFTLLLCPCPHYVYLNSYCEIYIILQQIESL